MRTFIITGWLLLISLMGLSQKTKGLEPGKKIVIPYIHKDLGYFQGQVKYFFSTTQNFHQLKSDYAQAIGLYGKYESPIKFGFRAAISGYYLFNPGSSDLTQKDSITHLPNRYEIGLFDIEDPAYTDPIKKLEECYIRYQKSKISLTWGQQLINTPFVNLQDGRMRPTAVDAFWTKINLDSQQTIEVGWIDALSPRSTKRWMSVEESIGIYPSGINTVGQKSQYKGRISTDGIFIMGIKTSLSKNIKAQFWETYSANLFHVSMFQLDWQQKNKNDVQYYASVQGTFQKAIGNNNYANISQAYIVKGESAGVLSTRLGLKNKRTDISINYTRIFQQGRYLMPREWGREPFFTFMSRERNEGLGDVHAWVLKGSHTFHKQSISSGIALGIFSLPKSDDFKLNKYGMASYGQGNLDIRYTLPFAQKRIDVMALLVGKINLSSDPVPLKNLIQKVDMILFNFVLHYNF